MEYCAVMIKLLCFIALIVASCTLLSQPVAAQKQPLTLKPSSKWVASYEDDSCRLLRQFGTEDDTVTVIFNSFGPGDHFRLVLAGKPVRIRNSSRPATLQFGPSELAQEAEFLIGNLGKKPAMLFSGSMRIAAVTDAEKLARENSGPEYNYKLAEISTERKAAVTYLSIGRPLRKPVVLKLGSMEKPFAALATCVDELLTHWGINVEKHKTLSQPVHIIGNPGRWIKSNEYPLDMIREGQPALVQFRLSVDKTGKTTACHIQQTTRPKEFDDAVCRSLMKRSAFKPALDAEGQPIASYWRSTVRFQIPR